MRKEYPGKNALVPYSPAPHLQFGPQPNHKNPLLVRLIKICNYFKKENTYDNYGRKSNFRELLIAISSGDIQKSLEVLAKGKEDFGKTRIYGVKINQWGTERYYNLLVKLYDEKALTEANIKAMPRDVRDTDLEKYIQDEFYWVTQKIFGIESKSPYTIGRKPKKPDSLPLTHEDTVEISKKFLDFYGLPTDYVPQKALPPADASELAALGPEQGVPANNIVLPPMSDQALRKIHGMSDAEHEMFQLSLETRRVEHERQTLLRRWEDLRQRVQPANPTATAVPPSERVCVLPDPFEVFSEVPPVTVSRNGHRTQSARPAPSSQPSYSQSSNQNGFLAPPRPPYQNTVHLAPVSYTTDDNNAWDILGISRNNGGI